MFVVFLYIKFRSIFRLVRVLRRLRRTDEISTLSQPRTTTATALEREACACKSISFYFRLVVEKSSDKKKKKKKRYRFEKHAAGRQTINRQATRV